MGQAVGAGVGASRVPVWTASFEFRIEPVFLGVKHYLFFRGHNQGLEAGARLETDGGRMTT